MANQKGKIFTKLLKGEDSVASTESALQQTYDEFEAQEDIYIIGFEISVSTAHISSGFPIADGSIVHYAEGTFHSETDEDSFLGSALLQVVRHHVGSPASGEGWVSHAPARSVMFPAGTYIEMTEGEIISLICNSRNNAGVTVVFQASLRLYFTEVRPT